MIAVTWFRIYHPNKSFPSFLICGTEDEHLCYPPYLQFADSLEAYNIDYRSSYSAYDHGTTDLEAYALMWQWMDSLAFISYQTLDVNESYLDIQGTISIYPNPLSQTSCVSFRLNSPEYVSINILNQQGALIQKLPKKWYATGLHEIRFNTDNFHSGIYLLQLTSGKQVVSRKVVKL